MNYNDAGVNIAAADTLVNNIKPIVAKTHNPNVLNGLGGFGAMFKLPTDLESPVLVSGTDGVGTKLLVAIEHNDFSTIGIDLVAMCANDIIVQGAKPLFFLDYLATGSLDVEQTEQVIGSIARGCTLADIALVGGETAEMPGMYHDGHFDLAGFCVGVVEEHKIIDGSQIKKDDVLIGIASSGPHSNGYSLIRKIIEESNIDMSVGMEGKPFSESIMEPTRIYVNAVLGVMETVNIKGLAHITGGGITDNVPRMLPEGLSAQIDPDTWTHPAIFDAIQEHGEITPEDMLSTFNCGIGMIMCVNSSDAKAAMDVMTQLGETVFLVGNVFETRYNQEDEVVYEKYVPPVDELIELNTWLCGEFTPVKANRQCITIYPSSKDSKDNYNELIRLQDDIHKRLHKWEILTVYADENKQLITFIPKTTRNP